MLAPALALVLAGMMLILLSSLIITTHLGSASLRPLLCTRDALKQRQKEKAHRQVTLAWGSAALRASSPVCRVCLPPDSTPRGSVPVGVRPFSVSTFSLSSLRGRSAHTQVRHRRPAQVCVRVWLGPEDGEDAGHFPHSSDLIPDDFLPDGAGSAWKRSADGSERKIHLRDERQDYRAFPEANPAAPLTTHAGPQTARPSAKTPLWSVPSRLDERVLLTFVQVVHLRQELVVGADVENVHQHLRHCWSREREDERMRAGPTAAGAHLSPRRRAETR